MDVNEELKFLGKFTGGSGGGVGLVGASGWWGGVRVDVNAMLGVGGDVGYGGCEPRIESIVQCTKRYCTILRKRKNVFFWLCQQATAKIAGWLGGGGGQDGCERKIEVFAKIQKKKYFFFWGGGVGSKGFSSWGHKKKHHCATAKRVTPTGNRLDSFVTGACGPDLSGPLWFRISKICAKFHFHISVLVDMCLRSSASATPL